jgi:hypothetical protein
MSNREFIDKNGNRWTWEETPETIEALKKLQKSVTEANVKILNGGPVAPKKLNAPKK